MVNIKNYRIFENSLRTQINLYAYPNYDFSTFRNILNI